MTNLPDIQLNEPAIKIPIKRVGVERVTIPFILESRDSGYNEMVADVSMTTGISSTMKGISMSRLHLNLIKYLRKPLKHFLIYDILNDLRKSQDTDSSFISFYFLLPISRASPVSNYKFPIFYPCIFEGQLYQENGNEKFRFIQGVTVQYSSYCPCSAKLSEYLKNVEKSQGFPHAQRSFARVIIETRDPNYIWLEDIIELVEKSIKTIPYPIVKRVDEMEIARIAAENPIFVEDAIRQISEKLIKREDIEDWIVKCVHEESIHTSEAIAINWKGVPGGFGEKYSI